MRVKSEFEMENDVLIHPSTLYEPADYKEQGVVIPELADVVKEYFGSMPVPKADTTYYEAYGGHKWLTEATYSLNSIQLAKLEARVRARAHKRKEYYEAQGDMEERVYFSADSVVFMIPNIERYIKRALNEV